MCQPQSNVGRPVWLHVYVHIVYKNIILEEFYIVIEDTKTSIHNSK